MAKIILHLVPDTSKVSEALKNLKKEADSLSGKKIDLGIDAQAAKAIAQAARALADLQRAQNQATIAHEKSAQAIEKTKQETAKAEREAARYGQQIEKTRQATEKTAQAEQKTAQAREKTTQTTERTRQAEERTVQARERTTQATEKTRQEELKLQREQEKTSRAMELGAGVADALSVALGNIASRAFHMVISKITQAFREALSTMKEVDTELANIQKVTDQSNAAIERLGDAAYETASKYGIAASEYLAAAGDFAKAGYDNYDVMAELATKTQLVGDVSAEVASKFLLSADAAWKFGGNVNDLSAVLDKANVIENNYATSIEKLASGFPLVASTASMAGMTVDQTLAALGTITAKTQESGTMAARALRALILNILGDTQTEIEDGVTWTEEELKSLNGLLWKYAGEAMETARKNGGVVNPMEAIKALHDAYEEGLLTQKDLTDLAMDLGGKLRTNQLLALIQNFDTFNEMLDKTANSAGSADKEIDTMLGTWESKTNQLKNTWTNFVSDIVETDVIKGGVDLLRDSIQALDDQLTGESGALRNVRKEYADIEEEIAALESRGENLNRIEQERLEILKQQRDAKQEEINQAAGDQYQKLWGYEITGDSFAGYEKKDITGQNISGLLEAIESARGQYLETKNIQEYANALQTLAAQYDVVYRAAKDAVDAGVEVDSRVPAFIHTFENLETAANASDEEITKLTNGRTWNKTDQEQAIFDFWNIDINNATAATDELAKAADAVNFDSATQSAAGLTAQINQAKAAAAGFHTTDGIGWNGRRFTFFNVPGMASGGVSGGGRTLVNELGPELISDRGRAYIANGGRPAVVNLSRGAVVVPANQTRAALRGGGMPTRSAAAGMGPGRTQIADIAGTIPLPAGVAFGLRDKRPHAEDDWTSALVAATVAATEVVTGGGGGGGRGGSSAPVKNISELAENLNDLLSNLDKQATLAGNEENWSRQAEIYEQAQEAIKKMVEDYREAGYADDSDEILDLLNKNYDYANKQLTLYQSKWDELIKALDADTAAQETANILAEKQQAVDDAREALANAQKQRTVRMYNAATGQWEWIADESKVQSAQKSLTSAEKTYTDTVKSQSIKELENLKNTAADLTDVVLGPALSSIAMMAESTQEFQNFAKALDAVYGVGTFLNSTEGSQNVISTKDSHDTVYQFNGLKLSDQEAQTMTVAQLAQRLQVLGLTN